MSPLHPFDDKYWNLAQACAWVEYREKQLVNDFSVADRNAYMALGMYPSMWPKGRKRLGSVEELRRALEQGLIKSSGYRRHTPESLEEIPAAEWTDLVIRPPLVGFSGQPSNQPWSAVRVLSADMKKLWHDIGEVSLRTKFDWAEIKTIYEAIVDRQPTMSMNKKIEDLQIECAERFNKEPPSRSTIQNKIKTWP
ncbi:hypothetical protein [Sulfitobacter sp. SK011]|uniref:hypothetical protein n=1 Tax=Sulfitobacter sp. SK011 TaxID=1389004 RepID=UPI000E0C6CF2|nr:hypothetical protein [Sulfitobacter sp. SK011]AXI41341.1 hypothetical protein C1J02_04735 [Sulfitobacter sp. SK011]